MTKVAIIGAGIIGTATAIHLQKLGAEVVIIDKKGPAEGTSYGNAGVLAAASVVPVTMPGIWKKIVPMVVKKNSPLFVQWSQLPRLTPFLAKYLLNANTRKVNQIADALSMLLHDCPQQHINLAKGTGAEKFISTGDYLFAYKNKNAYMEDKLAWEMRKIRGHPFEEMNQKQIKEYDPCLEDKFGFAVKCLNHGYIKDPAEYIKTMFGCAIKNGAEFIKEEVTDIKINNNNVEGVVTDKQTINADHVVVAAGVWSKKILKCVGVNVPMEAERGYHIEFVNPSITLKNPTMIAESKFVLTPMNGRLRAAGIAEFGGLNDKKSKAPINLLKKQTKKIFPNLKYDKIEEWIGHRPSTTDSLPVIGNLDKHKNLWSAFGHQHIGLSGGPKTGYWIANLIMKNNVNQNLKPFGPDRFK